MLRRGRNRLACSHVSSVLEQLSNSRKKRPELVEAGWDLSKPSCLRLLLSLDTVSYFGLEDELVVVASCAGGRCGPAAAT